MKEQFESEQNKNVTTKKVKNTIKTIRKNYTT